MQQNLTGSRESKDRKKTPCRWNTPPRRESKIPRKQAPSHARGQKTQRRTEQRNTALKIQPANGDRAPGPNKASDLDFGASWLHSHTPLTTTVRSLFSLSAFRACDSFLQSSRPLQEWASSIRCLEQKWPWQKLQSPTMRWAASLHSLKLQRGLRGAMDADVCMCVVYRDETLGVLTV